MLHTISGTIELVIFKTQDGFSDAEVRASAQSVNLLLTGFDGFISRKLAKAADGTWADIVYWRDVDSAARAAREIMADATAQRFFQMIDESTMQFMHLEPVLDYRHT